MGSKEALLALSPLGGAAIPMAGAALSDATRNKILDVVGLQDYMSADEQEKRAKEKEMGMQAAKQPGMKKGGKASSASKRADGCAVKGKTRGRIV